MSSNAPKIDGAAVHQEAVSHAHALGVDAVAHAQSVKDALHLADAPVSPNAPPPYPAPPYPAPPYPPVAAKPALVPAAQPEVTEAQPEAQPEVAAAQPEALPDPPVPPGA